VFDKIDYRPIITYQSLTVVSVGLQTFIMERRVLVREHHNAMYHIWIYYVCKMLAEVSNATLLVFFTLLAYLLYVWWLLGLVVTRWS